MRYFVFFFLATTLFVNRGNCEEITVKNFIDNCSGFGADTRLDTINSEARLQCAFYLRGLIDAFVYSSDDSSGLRKICLPSGELALEGALSSIKSYMVGRESQLADRLSTHVFLALKERYSCPPSIQTRIDTSTSGGPARGHIATNKILIATGVYFPTQNIDVNRGDTVTWEVRDGGDAVYLIESDKGSAEQFSSSLLRVNDKFSHTFINPGVFGFHDKFNGNLVGTVTVRE